MVEYQILKAFINDNSLYDKYYQVLKLDYIRENYPVLFKLFKCLPAKSLSELEIIYLSNYPVIKDGDRELIRGVLDNIELQEVALESILSYLEGHLTASIAQELALVSLELKEGKKSVLDVSAIYDKLNSVIVEDVQEELISTDLEELLKNDEEGLGLHWRLKCLNQSLGTLRKGNLGHIFATPETGKTAMWISEMTYMAEQVSDDNPILIFFNEEGGDSAMFRIFSAVTGYSYMELINSRKDAQRIYNAKVGNRIKFYKNAEVVNKKSIEAIVEKSSPSLVIIDNMDKVHGFSADREDLRLHAIYKWGRALAQKYCPVITIGQASDSASNSKFVTMSDMANSKTAKPSELDFIIGIGKIEKEGYNDVRFINVPKNKMRGDKNSIESMRHLQGKEVEIIPTLSIYKDL